MSIGLETSNGPPLCQVHTAHYNTYHPETSRNQGPSAELGAAFKQPTQRGRTANPFEFCSAEVQRFPFEKDIIQWFRQDTLLQKLMSFTRFAPGFSTLSVVIPFLGLPMFFRLLSGWRPLKVFMVSLQHRHAHIPWFCFTPLSLPFCCRTPATTFPSWSTLCTCTMIQSVTFELDPEDHKAVLQRCVISDVRANC